MSQRSTLSYFGWSFAVTVVGLIASAPITLEVATETGILCKGADLCRVSLPESGFLAVTLTSEAGASYQLLTN